ncbi:NADH dehydrogenase [ubiquinone] 1 subunit C1, mitochondrial [Vanacampus margaritifer]
MSVSSLLARSYFVHRVGSRTVFTSSKRDPYSPNWLRVGLAFGSSIFLWSLVADVSSSSEDSSAEEYVPDSHSTSDTSYIEPVSEILKSEGIPVMSY